MVRGLLRLLATAAVALPITLSVQPAAQAAGGDVFTVWDGSSYEYYKTCSATSPFPCSTNAQTMYVQITGTYPPKSFAITLGYQIEDITTTAGQDYTLATTGTVVMPANQYVTGLFVPLVADGLAESSETFRVHLTSSSVGGDISDTGIGTIWNDGLIPGDCSLSRTSLYTVAMSCTGRPPTQQWRSIADCGEEWPHVQTVLGPVVTGNGTSSTTCPSYAWKDSTFHTA
jgi:hypothetical protein